jgi:hypothetical protein
MPQRSEDARPENVQQQRTTHHHNYLEYIWYLELE